MSPSLIVSIAIVVIGLVVFVQSAVVVPEGSAYVVESLGRYSRTLGPGFHILMPFRDHVRFRHSVAEQALSIGTETCRTRDDREVFVDGTLAYRITVPERVSYAVADLRAGLTGVTRNAVRDAIQGVPLEDVHASRPRLETAVVRDVAAKTTPWGVESLRFAITDTGRHPKESHAWTH